MRTYAAAVSDISALDMPAVPMSQPVCIVVAVVVVLVASAAFVVAAANFVVASHFAVRSPTPASPPPSFMPLTRLV